MRIVFLYPISQDALNYLREELPHEIEIIARIRDEQSLDVPPNQDPEIIAAAKRAEILMGPFITEEILSQAIPKAGGKLKLIFIPWTGVNRLDFDLLKKYSVQVANSHGNARTVAEFALALLLTASKSIIHHDRLLREGDWSSRFSDRPSINLQGRIVGLLGLGAIGTECAKLLLGFDVKLIGCRRDPSKLTQEQKQMVQKVFSTHELKEFLKESDIIINSLPLTKETEGMLGEEEFKQMKDGVVLVNVGRGATIDEKAFYEAVKSGKVFAAGIDPQWLYPPRRGEREPDEKYFPSNYPIHEFDNVVLSPHRAADLVEGYERAHWKDVIENILRIYHGKNPINLVDLEKGY
ncbi:MAG: 2-hydroxyacid dehydrogenase [Promethearchaeota archaeon]